MWENGNTWAFAGVYGPPNRCVRRELWEELSGARASWGTPRVCRGDFNVVRSSYEKRRHAQRPAPFRFENMRLQVKGVKDIIRKWWEGYEVYGSPSYRLARKLRLLKDDLKRFNYIGKIRVDGALHEGQDSLASGIVGFYEELYKEPEQWILSSQSNQ
ncbi:hypothetical protein Acr_26g0002070 [Actinidia rufa]|uniref:DNAse I-like superfamily protein n=1 Tax=Actinidia rufa TaxID=165716 RepID=A0A7J0H1E9_9ERIC|nr:hypothetical protein Acr_26g0002070 [Actinidia rufa]